LAKWSVKKHGNFLLGRNILHKLWIWEWSMRFVPHADLENTAYEWAQEILGKSPMAIKMLKLQ
jgi:naphthoate synthase